MLRFQCRNISSRESPIVRIGGTQKRLNRIPAMFSVSQSLDKHAFIALYKDVVLLSALFVVGKSAVYIRKCYMHSLFVTNRHPLDYQIMRVASFRGKISY